MTLPQPLTYGAVVDTTLPLAVLVHGFPDTPFTWRHLGPDLAGRGYRVVAPWLPGYDVPTGQPISVGTYVRHLLDVRRRYHGDDRAADLLGDLGQYFPADGSRAEIIDGAGHFLHLEKPELVATTIGDWLGA